MTVEPIVFLDGDGVDILTNNGATKDVGQVFNCIIFLLFSDSNNYHHDVFLMDTNWRFRGNYAKTIKQPITMQMLSDLGSAVETDLSPLVDDKIISDLDSISKNTGGKRIETTISFKYNGEPISKTIAYENNIISLV